MLTVAELFRLQGFDPAEMTTTGLSPAKAGHLIGDAFARTVAQRILLDWLPHAGNVSKDHLWGTCAA